MPRFSEGKVAFAYLRLPGGNFPALASELSTVLVNSFQSSDERGRFFLALGGADLLIRLDLETYRPVNAIQHGFAETQARAISWAFAVPYQSQSDENPESGETPEPAGDLESREDHTIFLMQLRVRRKVYATYGVGAEGVLFDNIKRIEKSFEGKVRVEVLAGLGWADLIIFGSASCSQAELASFILHVRELSVVGTVGEGSEANVEEQAVFQRSITTVCFPCNESFEVTLPPDDFELVSLSRTRPGSFFHAVDESKQTDADDLISLQWEKTVDGTYDLCSHVVVHSSRGSAAEILGRVFHAGPGNLIPARTAAPSQPWPIERSRSHVLVAEPSDLKFDKVLATVDGLSLKPLVEIRSPDLAQISKIKRLAGSLAQARKEGFQIVATGVIPLALGDNLHRLAENLKSASEDPSSYSDAFPALECCVSSAVYYLEELDKARDRYLATTNFSERVRVKSEIAALIDHLESWCLFTPRIMVERSVGRFGDLFGDGSHVFASIGGLQKTLFLADMVAMNFQERIAEIPGLPAPKRQIRRLLTSVFDTVDGIRSFPSMGVIRLPLRHRFSLARLLPGIWHEVAQAFFFDFFPDEEESGRFVWNSILKVEQVEETLGQHGLREELTGVYYKYATDIFCDWIVMSRGFGTGATDDFYQMLCIHTFEDVLAIEILEEERLEQIAVLIFRILISKILLRQHGKGCGVDLEVSDEALNSIMTQLVEVVVGVALRNRYKGTWVRQVLLGDAPDTVLARPSIGSSPFLQQLVALVGQAVERLSDPVFLEVLEYFLRPLAGPISAGDCLFSPKALELFSQLGGGEVLQLERGSIGSYYFKLYRLETARFLTLSANLTPPQRRGVRFKNEESRERAALARSAVCDYYTKQVVDSD